MKDMIPLTAEQIKTFAERMPEILRAALADQSLTGLNVSLAGVKPEELCHPLTAKQLTALRTLLLQYAKAQGLSAGPVFVTRSGRPVSRTAVWRDMKALCLAAAARDAAPWLCEKTAPPKHLFSHDLKNRCILLSIF